MNWHFLHLLSLWVAVPAGLLAVARTVAYFALVSDDLRVLILKTRGFSPVWKGRVPGLVSVISLVWFFAGPR